MPESKGHYVRNKDGTRTWLGSCAEELAYWYRLGREHGRKDAEKEAKGGTPGR